MRAKFMQIFGDEHDLEYFSPGRVNLIGEHIDYNGGLVLPMAINLGTYGFLKMRNDKTVRVYSMNFDDIGVISFNINNIEYDEKDYWANYVKGVIDVFQKENYEMKNGFDLLVKGTIPNGSGLSSSASLEVLIGQILIDNNGFDIDGAKLAQLAQKAENEFIGVNCGIMDQFIIANGTHKGALLINTGTLEYENQDVKLGSNKIVVINSKKKRGLVDSAYNMRRKSCDSVYLIAKEKFGINTLCDLTLVQLDELELSHEDYMRAKHVIEENLRVKEFVKCLKENNLERIGQILYEGHASLRDLFEVSCEQLDFIVDQCHDIGAVGARMTGAGFGGCCIAIMPKQKINELEKVKEKYFTKYGLLLEYYEVEANDKTKRIN